MISLLQINVEFALLYPEECNNFLKKWGTSFRENIITTAKNDYATIQQMMSDHQDSDSKLLLFASNLWMLCHLTEHCSTHIVLKFSVLSNCWKSEHQFVRASIVHITIQYLQVTEEKCWIYWCDKVPNYLAFSWVYFVDTEMNWEVIFHMCTLVT